MLSPRRAHSLTYLLIHGLILRTVLHDLPRMGHVKVLTRRDGPVQTWQAGQQVGCGDLSTINTHTQTTELLSTLGDRVDSGSERGSRLQSNTPGTAYSGRVTAGRSFRAVLCAGLKQSGYVGRGEAARRGSWGIKQWWRWQYKLWCSYVGGRGCWQDWWRFQTQVSQQPQEWPTGSIMPRSLSFTVQHSDIPSGCIQQSEHCPLPPHYGPNMATSSSASATWPSTYIQHRRILGQLINNVDRSSACRDPGGRDSGLDRGTYGGSAQSHDRCGQPATEVATRTACSITPATDTM